MKLKAKYYIVNHRTGLQVYWTDSQRTACLHCCDLAVNGLVSERFAVYDATQPSSPIEVIEKVSQPA